MKNKLWCRSILAGILFMPLNIFAQLPPSGNYKVDVARSTVSFKIKNLGVVPVFGQFKFFSSTVKIGDHLEECSVTGSVDTASIDTKIKMRDKDLKSNKFFNVEKYPEMTFKSAQITGTLDSFQMSGDLTIKDKTNPVVFDCKLIKDSDEFIAETKINRKNFNLMAGPTISDELLIQMKICLLKAE